MRGLTGEICKTGKEIHVLFKKHKLTLSSCLKKIVVRISKKLKQESIPFHLFKSQYHCIENKFLVVALFERVCIEYVSAKIVFLRFVFFFFTADLKPQFSLKIRIQPLVDNYRKRTWYCFRRDILNNTVNSGKEIIGRVLKEY